ARAAPLLRALLLHAGDVPGGGQILEVLVSARRRIPDGDAALGRELVRRPRSPLRDRDGRPRPPGPREPPADLPEGSLIGPPMGFYPQMTQILADRTGWVLGCWGVGVLGTAKTGFPRHPNASTPQHLNTRPICVYLRHLRIMLLSLVTCCL